MDSIGVALRHRIFLAWISMDHGLMDRREETAAGIQWMGLARHGICLFMWLWMNHIFCLKIGYLKIKCFFFHYYHYYQYHCYILRCRSVWYPYISVGCSHPIFMKFPPGRCWCGGKPGVAGWPHVEIIEENVHGFPTGWGPLVIGLVYNPI